MSRAALIATLGLALERRAPDAVDVDVEDAGTPFMDWSATLHPAEAREVARALLDDLAEAGYAVTRGSGT